MLVVIKSSPETHEARRAVRLARDMAADIVLLQNAAWLAQEERLEGFCGTVYALDEDLRLRGVVNVDSGVKSISYGEFVDLMADEDKVVGIF